MQGPSQHLINVLSKSRSTHQVQNAINVVKKEFEVYSFMSDRVPTQFTDSHWNRILSLKTPRDRVNYWKFLALNEHRAKQDEVKRKLKREKLLESKDEERIKFESGRMGYGNSFYQMISSRGGVEGMGIARLADVERLKDVPKLAFDFQLIDSENLKARSNLELQLRELHSYQRLQSVYPFPLELINVNQKSENVKSMIECFGFLNRRSPPPFLPTTIPFNPYKGRKDVIYISKHARHVLDGPLTYNTYILPITYGTDKVCLSSALRDKIKPMALPIRKYMKWSGPINYPLVNVYKVLEMVARTGGDWEMAIRSTYSKRYMMSEEERRNLKKMPAVSMALERRMEAEEIVRMIEQGVTEKVSL